MVDISAEESRDWWSGKEGDLFAAIVTSCEAGFAFAADDVWFDRNSIANFEACDRGVDCEDCASRFVSENVVVGNNHGANTASMPEVDIRSVREELAIVLKGSRKSYPQIPVLLIPIVTSPSFKPSPLATVSTAGSALPIHKLWAGLVYTPMLGFEVSVDMVVVSVFQFRKLQDLAVCKRI